MELLIFKVIQFSRIHLKNKKTRLYNFDPLKPHFYM